MRLNDRVAIITGGSRGIGKAITRRFSAEGAKVVVNYKESAGLAENIVNEIRSAGGEAIAVQADVSQRAQTDHLRDETLDAFGQIDVLISNAGIIIDKPYIESTEEDWNAAMDLWATMTPSLLYAWSGNYIAKVKHASRLRGFDGGAVRRPLTPLSADEEKALAASLEPLG